ALAALGVAGVVADLIARARGQGDKETRRQREVELEDLPLSRSPGRRSVVGRRSSFLHPLAIVLSVVLVLFAGNQGGALQVVTGTQMAVALDADELGRAIVNGLGPREPTPLDAPFQGPDAAGTTLI